MYDNNMLVVYIFPEWDVYHIAGNFHMVKLLCFSQKIRTTNLEWYIRYAHVAIASAKIKNHEISSKRLTSNSMKFCTGGKFPAIQYVHFLTCTILLSYLNSWTGFLCSAASKSKVLVWLMNSLTVFGALPETKDNTQHYMCCP